MSEHRLRPLLEVGPWDPLRRWAHRGQSGNHATTSRHLDDLPVLDLVDHAFDVLLELADRDRLHVMQFALPILAGQAAAAGRSSSSRSSSGSPRRSGGPTVPPSPTATPRPPQGGERPDLPAGQHLVLLTQRPHQRRQRRRGRRDAALAMWAPELTGRSATAPTPAGAPPGADLPGPGPRFQSSRSRKFS